MKTKMKNYPVSWNSYYDDLARKLAQRKGLGKSSYLRELILREAKKEKLIK